MGYQLYLLLLHLLLSLSGCSGSTTSPGCCQSLKIAGEAFTLINDNYPGLTQEPYNCWDNCLYQRTSDSQTFCLKSGDDETQCTEPECVCGIKKDGTNTSSTGAKVDGGEWPWSVGVYFTTSNEAVGSYLGGGSLISEKWILTAASTVTDNKDSVLPPAFTRLVFGFIHVQPDKGNLTGALPRHTVQPSQIKWVIKHPDYLHNNKGHNDIALIGFNYTLRLTVYKPVCLPTLGATYVGTTGALIGTGYINNTDVNTKLETQYLYEVQSTVRANSECVTEFGLTETISGTLCADRIEEMPCKFDKGHPLMAENTGSNKIEVIGLVNGYVNDNCGTETVGDKTIYTAVADFKTWITDTMSNNGGSGIICS